MPRRRLTNEQDAVNLLADCAVRASRGNMPAHQLHAITSAMATYSNLLKTRRESDGGPCSRPVSAKGRYR
jgi:hypothetical protein